jgi:hypothetical protein
LPIPEKRGSLLELIVSEEARITANRARQLGSTPNSARYASMQATFSVIVMGGRAPPQGKLR